MNPISPEGQRPEGRYIPISIYVALALLALEGVATVAGGIRNGDLLLTFFGGGESGVAVTAFMALSRLRR